MSTLFELSCKVFSRVDAAKVEQCCYVINTEDGPVLAPRKCDNMQAIFHNMSVCHSMGFASSVYEEFFASHFAIHMYQAPDYGCDAILSALAKSPALGYLASGDAPVTVDIAMWSGVIGDSQGGPLQPSATCVKRVQV